jgi:L-iditol 2-dehydrogenase
MHIARIHGAGDVRLHDEDRPRPAPGEALVRVRAVGLCGSDVHWFAEGGIDERRLIRPFVLGHEFAGTTEDGRRVALDPAIPCGDCAPCLEGHANLCRAIRFAGDGVNDGALREWVAWPERCLVPLPDSLSDADGALLEPLGIALHAVDLAHLRTGAKVGVFGCGPIGLLLLQVARLSGARLFATELAGRPHRLEAARALGAEAFTADAGREGGLIRDAAGGGGLDVALEAAGDNAAIDAAVEAVRPGARVVVVGIPSEPRISFLAGRARRKGLTFVLSQRMGHVYSRAVHLVAGGRVDVRSLVTHRFPLAEIRSAFDAAARREGLKVLVEP